MALILSFALQSFTKAQDIPFIQISEEEKQALLTELNLPIMRVIENYKELIEVRNKELEWTIQDVSDYGAFLEGNLSGLSETTIARFSRNQAAGLTQSNDLARVTRLKQEINTITQSILLKQQEIHIDL